MSLILFSILIGLFMLVPGVLAEDIRDVKPPVDLPANMFWIYVLGAVAAVIVGIFLTRFISDRIRKKKSPPSIVLPPWVITLGKLEQLKAQNLPAKGQIKEYYSLLSYIVRRYLEDRFSFKAPEMTTPEFLWFLKGSSELTADQKSLLTDFLNSCDLVKFAKYGPSLKEIEESFLSAKKLVEETQLVSETANNVKK